MPEYVGEVANDENWEKRHRTITVVCEDSRAALNRINQLKKPEETVYQICTEVEGASLPQPVFDFFNGFTIYE